MKKALVIFTSLLSFNSPLWAGAGTTAATFLQQNLNARLVGIAGSFASTAQGTEAILTNPAGMVRANQPEVNTSYTSSQSQSYRTMILYSHPLEISGIQASVGGGLDYYSAGNIDIFNSDGVNSQTLKAEQALGVSMSVSMKPIPFLTVGLTPKFIRSKLVEQYSASGVGVDLGVMGFPIPQLSDRLVLGAAVQNLGTKLKHRDAKSDLPRTESFGASVVPWMNPIWGALMMTAQVERSKSEKTKYKVGFEYNFGSSEKRALFFRGGTQMHSDENLSIGIGFREKRISLDYAFVGSVDLDKSHRLTLIYRFGKPAWDPTTPPSKRLIQESKELKPTKFELIEEDERFTIQKKTKEKDPRAETDFYIIEENMEQQLKKEGEEYDE